MVEEKAIPEPIIIKYHILNSYFAGARQLASCFQKQKLGKFSPVEFSKFVMYVCELYLKLGLEIDKKKKKLNAKEEKIIEKMDKYIIDTVDISNNEWIMIYKVLQKIVRELGISKIGLKQYDLGSSFKRR